MIQEDIKQESFALYPVTGDQVCLQHDGFKDLLQVGTKEVIAWGKDCGLSYSRTIGTDGWSEASASSSANQSLSTLYVRLDEGPGARQMAGPKMLAVYLQQIVVVWSVDVY